MKVKKFVALLIGSLMMMSSVAGCGGTSAGKNLTDTAEAVTDKSDNEAGTEETGQTADDSAVSFKKKTVSKDDYTSDGKSASEGVFYTSYETLVIDGSQAVISGEDAAPEASDALQSALDDYNSSVKKVNEEFFSDVKYDAESQYSENKDDWNYSNYYDNIYASVMRSDGRVLSILTTDESNQNGAHPYTTYTAYNYDLTTGQEIGISDLFSDTDALAATLSEDLQSQYPDAGFYADTSDGDETLEGDIQELIQGEGYAGGFTYYMTPADIVFVFSQYSIAPYAAGSFSIAYPYDSDIVAGNADSSYAGSDTLKGSITEAVPEIETNFTEEKDITHSLMISEVPSADTDASDPSDFDVTVTFDGKKGTSTLHTFRTDYYLAETDDSEFYLLADTHEENDWETIYIYDLNGDEIGDPEASEYGFYDSVPLNTDAFAAGTRADILSTYTCTGLFSISDGKLQAASDWFAVTDELSDSITLNEDLTCRVADDTSSAPDKLSFTEEKLPAGTTLKFLRTDNKKTVDLTTDDNRVVRLTIDSADDYPQTIDGKSVEDLFSGTVFAG